MIQNLTEGESQRTLIKYTLPMFISVVFQQFYNMADSMIAGKFAGEDALAAVGASYPITMIFMAVAVGSNIGCSVVLSQLFGAKAYEKVHSRDNDSDYGNGSLGGFDGSGTCRDPGHDAYDTDTRKYFWGWSALSEDLYRRLCLPFFV